MDLTEGLIFNQMSEYYDKYRPGYPEEIIHTIVQRAGLTSKSKVLEIGSGSGKATAQLIDYDFEMLCVEPGEDLVRRSRERFKGKNISFAVSRLEDCSLPERCFDAIVSAQAFHWIEKPKGLEICAASLKNGGCLMPFWNIEILRDTRLDDELLDIMTRYDAFTATMKEADYEKRVTRISKELAQGGFFHQPDIVQVSWRKTYTAHEYFGFVMTGNEFIKNSDGKKAECYEALKRLSEKFGGIARDYICELYIAQKAGVSP